MPGQFVKLNVGQSLFVAKSPNLMMSAECTTLTVLALVYVEKYWIVKVFANLMNDAQFYLTMLVNTVKLLLKICHQIHQNIPHCLLYQQQFAKILPLHFSHVQCPETNSCKHVFLDKFICIG